MPNLFSPDKFNMFGFTKEIKALRSEFVISSSALDTPFENVDFYSCVDTSSRLSIKLGTSENEIFGAIRLAPVNFLGVDYQMVERVCTVEKYRGKGIMKLLYSHCLELGHKVMSDSTQTTFGSKDFWIKAKVYYPEKSLYVVNLSSNYKRLYTNQPEYKIWGKESDDDFDLLTKDDKIALLELMKGRDGLSNPQFDYFVNNIDNLTDRKNVRLTLE